MEPTTQHPHALTYTQLTTLTGCKTPQELAADLAANNIKFFRGKRGRPWTTIEALNAALGIKPQPQQPQAPTITVR